MSCCLIIDDDRIYRRMAKDILEAHGHQTRAAATGKEGLEAYRAGPSDLVLLDLVLPDVSGYDLLSELTGNGAHSNVIVTTSFFSLDSALQVLRNGAGDYLPKPFSEETLLMSVERVLERTRLERDNLSLSAQLQRRVDELQVLHRISHLILSSRQMSTWMDDVVRATCGYAGAEAGSLLLLDQSSDELVFYVSTGPQGDAVREIRMPRGRGIAWWCLSNQRSIRVNDAQGDARFDRSVDSVTGFVTRNILAAPIVVGEECIGVIELVNRIGGASFSTDDQHRLEELSSHIAVAVQNAITVRDLQRSREELVRWSQQLEGIVHERTRALRQANQARQAAYNELEHSHRKLKQAHAWLVEREKMAAVGLLSAGVAHEINNPLAFINANLSTLEQYVRSLRRLAGVVLHACSRANSDQPDQIARLVREAQRVIEEERIRDLIDDIGSLFDEMSAGLTRITSIVEQLRTFAEDGTVEGALAPVDLNCEVRRLVELIQGAAADKLTIHTDLVSVPQVDVSIRGLRQILLALLHPAEREGEDIREVWLRTCWHQGDVVLELVEPSREVSDEDLDRLFDPFFVPGKAGQPGGLALSTAYGLARSMGASVRAMRQPEGGLCIQLAIPAAEPMDAKQEKQA